MCGYMPKGGHVHTMNRAQLERFDYTEFSYLHFSSVIMRMAGYNMQRRDTTRTPPGMTTSPTCLIFPASLILHTTNLG